MFLRKLQHSGIGHISYSLADVDLNSLLGKNISITHTGKIECVACSRPIKKTFGEGYCYPCFMSLARCDLCIVRPERCHYHLGTCREPEWGENHCLIPHVVYIANTTGLKVGITRLHKRFERWGDQGAREAIAICMVHERLHAGIIEQELAANIADKTDWRALITGKDKDVDLPSIAQKVRESVSVHKYSFPLPEDVSANSHIIHYPILNYPKKPLTWNLDKTSTVSGPLHGIRGQYLFIAERALNIRKYSGYEVEITF